MFAPKGKLATQGRIWLEHGMAASGGRTVCAPLVRPAGAVA